MRNFDAVALLLIVVFVLTAAASRITGRGASATVRASEWWTIPA